MSQAWLFDDESAGSGQSTQAATMAGGPHSKVVRFHPDFASWQALARSCLSRRIAPAQLWWQPDPAAPPRPAAAAAADGDMKPVRVPAAFMEKARLVACHRDDERWALLYELIWRMESGERHLLELHGDRQVLQLHALARAVSRDIHKMKAFVRFRAVPDGDAPAGSEEAEPRYVAWFEPEHFIVEQVSGFFRRRFGGMRWSILTPDRCMHWDGDERGQVWFTPGVDRAAAPPEDAFEDAWRLYYRSIFNPARLKVRAMLSEMPQKYWKNLPEAQVIPALVQAAHQRSASMQAIVKPQDVLRCGPRPPPLAELAAGRLAQSQEGTLEQVGLRAAGCRRCPLWEPATQTVWGEGPANARIMLVGEQPGDQEDLAGQPFVGPAGRLLDRALGQAGLDRRTLYLTNTVKHFKFKSRGKRRLHEKPLDAEILACIPWLKEEIARVKPALIVCLGATAARAQLGRPVRMNDERGCIIDGAPPLLLTFHPSYLLRLPDEAAAAAAFDKLVQDLRLAAHFESRATG